jgi:hypothetical protein
MEIKYSKKQLNDISLALTHLEKADRLLLFIDHDTSDQLFAIQNKLQQILKE